MIKTFLCFRSYISYWLKILLKWNSRSTWFDEDYLINQKWFKHGSAHMHFAEMQSQSSCIYSIGFLLHGEYLIISRIDSDFFDKLDLCYIENMYKYDPWANNIIPLNLRCYALFA